MARRAVAKFGLKVSKACELFGLSRTMYYSQSESNRIQRNAALIEALNKVVEKHWVSGSVSTSCARIAIGGTISAVIGFTVR